MLKNKRLLYIIIAVTVIGLSIVGATYAYFLASGYSNKTSTVSVTAEALDEVVCTATDLSMTVNGSDMKQGSSSSSGTLAKSNTGTISCTATKHTTGTTKCTMDIKYTPTNAFVRSANNTSKKRELTLSGTGVSTNGIISEPIIYENEMSSLTSTTTLIDDLEWVFSSNDTMTYTMTAKFYNYDYNQNDLAGKTYSGTISATNITCTGDAPTYNTVTLNVNGGSVSPSTKQVATGYTYGNLPTATKSGSSFKGWSILPSEYQQVEYIATDSNQYITTNVSPSGNMIIDAVVQNDSSFTGAQPTFLGVSGFQCYYNPRAGFWGSGSSGTVSLVTNIYTTDQIIHYIATTTSSGSSLNINGNVTSTSTVYTPSNSNTLYIFRYGSNYPFKGRLYNLKIYDNNSLIKEYIPCYRKSDNVIGLYDLVNNTFHTKSGTGDLTKGNDTYITKDSLVSRPGNHTLYAVWQ